MSVMLVCPECGSCDFAMIPFSKPVEWECEHCHRVVQEGTTPPPTPPKPPEPTFVLEEGRVVYVRVDHKCWEVDDDGTTSIERYAKQQATENDALKERVRELEGTLCDCRKYMVSSLDQCKPVRDRMVLPNDHDVSEMIHAIEATLTQSSQDSERKDEG
jgi:hypothetical protein